MPPPRRPAGKAVLAKLSEALFIETLRRYIATMPEDQTGWLAGARDAEVGRALALLHRNPAQPWTIASLAERVGVSRSVLAERFRFYLDEPPIAYLTRWRLQLVACMLKSTSQGVAQIAAQAGYESEAAFNRAFQAPLRRSTCAIPTSSQRCRGCYLATSRPACLCSARPTTSAAARSNREWRSRPSLAAPVIAFSATCQGRLMPISSIVFSFSPAGLLS